VGARVHDVHGLGKLLNEKMGISPSVEHTGGPVHENQLLEVEQLDLTITTEAHCGKDGMDWGLRKKDQNIRVVYFTYPQPFHAYALKKSDFRQFMMQTAGFMV